MLADGSRFVASGNGSDGATAWTSTDGLAWDEHAVPNKVYPDLGNPAAPLEASMGILGRLGDTVYSFGGASFIDTFHPAGWRWTDGSTWELIESSSPFFQSGNVTALVASDSALVAVDRLPFAYADRVWRWTAETSWVATDVNATDPADLEPSLLDVAWDGERYVAVGWRAERDDPRPPEERTTIPSAWRSTDGMTWELVEFPNAAGAICDVEALAHRGFVALGRTDDRVTTWSSSDGLAWATGVVEPNGELSLATNPFDLSCHIAADDAALVAFISNADGSSTFTWTSRDGLDWRRAGVLPVLVNSVAVIGETVLGSGRVLAIDTPGATVLYRGTFDR